ncbi:hypothetical protein ASE21_20905 [Flavobacterium sp. Root901]|uniref:LemA family protein n=1 Tax=Flavobacterium sp. Root901 TaxID=1736605 RepID=UPI00070D5FC3|nr:LemA family protein [Flavobacterium sp. Root901]KRD05419.1 hypothetical protein ASE21_20905 [Flavobacterium sp. Root901]
MKKTFKYVFIIIVSIIVIIFLSIHFYKNVVVENLTNKNKIATEKWSELYNYSNDRQKLLENFLDSTNKDANDTLENVLHKNKEKYKLYTESCSIQFVKLQYDINKEYLKILSNHSVDSTSNQTIAYKILQELKELDIKSNNVIAEYNEATLDYNKYISIFPNFYFAKSGGFHKKKYFTIKYGVKNDDPIVKSKELPAWAKDQDTL